MTTCPECGSDEITLRGMTLWTLHCDTCGHVTSGTASFIFPDQVGEPDNAVVFRFTCLDQLRSIRTVVPGLAGLSTVELVTTVRAGGMQLVVGVLPFWQAEEYVEKATKAGIDAFIRKKNQA